MITIVFLDSKSSWRESQVERVDYKDIGVPPIWEGCERKLALSCLRFISFYSSLFLGM